MQFIKGKNIPFSIQLIKSDNSYEEDATVTYDIYQSDLTTVCVSAQTASWNDTFNCYHDELDVSANWPTQSIGNYILKWNISDTDYFAANMIEDICILTDASSGSGLTPAQEAKIDNIYSEVTTYDQYKADVSSLAPSGEYNARLAIIQADLDNPDQYKADLSSLSVSGIADAVWDELAADHNIALSTGALLSQIHSTNTNSYSTSGSITKVVDFGTLSSGLSTVGYTLYNADSSEYQSRTTTGVYALSGGCYAASIDYENSWQGLIVWDTGTGSPDYVIDEFNSDGTVVRTVNFGTLKTGLSTVGYTLYNALGVVRTARTTDGVFELGSSGCYAAVISFEDAWSGTILWDTGTGTPDYAIDEYNVSQEVSVTSHINSNVKKVLGLVHSNIYMDNPVYDGDNNLVSLRIRIYSDAASVGTSNNVISTYSVTSVGDGCGMFSSWKSVEIG